MSRTKKIYFLSAFVLLIGCLALNLSYSLFVQTEEKEIVNSAVPMLESELSVYSVDLEPYQKILVKQTVSNTSAFAGMNYGLVHYSHDILSDEYEIKLVDTPYVNNSYGSIGPYEDAYIYLYVENKSDLYASVNFNLYKNYDTLDFNKFKDTYYSDDFEEELGDPYYSISVDDYYELTGGTINELPYDDKPQTLAFQSIEAFAKTQTLASDNIDELFPDYCSQEECVITLTDEMTSGDFEITAPDLSGTDVYYDGILKSGVHTVTDNEGTSYVFRGSNSTNYVDFAGFKWRIVRVNGDGSIRLVLDGTLEKVKRQGESSYAGTTSKFNEAAGDNAYVGFMYGKTGLTSYSSTTRCLMLVNGAVTDKRSTYNTQAKCEAAGGVWSSTSAGGTHSNVASSTIKQSLDTFYEKYLGGTTYNYEDYLSTTTSFCTDKSASYGYVLYMEEDPYSGYLEGNYRYYNSIYGTNPALYSAHSRLFYGGYMVVPGSEGSISPDYSFMSLYDIFWEEYQWYDTPMVGWAPYDIWNETPAVTLMCTTGLNINNNVTKYLTHPIGLLTADEVTLAGATNGESVYTYLNTGSSSTYWTMTPYGAGQYGSATAQVVTAGGSSTSLSYSTVTSALGVRPVINLKANIEVSSGNGTYSSPFQVKLPS